MDDPDGAGDARRPMTELTRAIHQPCHQHTMGGLEVAPLRRIPLLDLLLLFKSILNLADLPHRAPHPTTLEHRLHLFGRERIPFHSTRILDGSNHG